MIRATSRSSLLIAAALASTPALAEVANEKPVVAPSSGVTAQEFQGLSCLAGGSFAAAGAWGYSEIIATAAAAGPSGPLLVPIMATAFVAGCGVGSALSPGLLWIYRQFE